MTTDAEDFWGQRVYPPLDEQLAKRHIPGKAS
jgi:hypothetical protein